VNKRTWLGVHIIKYPTDLFLYQMMMYERKPDFLLETGTYKGGGTLFFASMFDLIGHGHVISVDYRKLYQRTHPRVTYITGTSTSDTTLKQIRDMVGSGSVMAVLDSNHHRGFVKRELVAYGRLVTSGQYLVCEDGYLNGHPIKPDYGPGPYEAVEWYLRHNSNFVQDPLNEVYMVTMTPNGWLRKL